MGQPVERQIAPGERHVYELDLAAGQYLRVAVRSLQIGLAASFGLDGDLLAEGGATLREGEQMLSAVTATAGRHWVAVSVRSGATADSYHIDLAELSAAAPADALRVASQRALAAALAEADPARAAGRVEGALHLAQEAGDAELECSALNLLGDRAYEQGAYDAVLAWSQQALAAARGGRAPWNEAYALNNLAVAFSRLDRPQESVARYREALDLWAALGEADQQGWTFNNLGQFLLNGLGDLEGAAQAYEQAEAIAQRLGSVRLEARAINGLALVARQRGELDPALTGFARALDLARQERDQITEAAILRNMASAHRSRGDFEEALRLLFLVLENQEATRQTKSLTYHSLATLYMDMGDLDQAQASYEQAYGLWLPEQEHAVYALINLGLVFKRKGDDAAALARWEEALGISQRTRYQFGEALARLYRGELALDQDEPGRALADLVPARDIFRLRKDRSQEAKALHQLGSAHQALGDPQAAAAAFDQALVLAEGDPALTAVCLHKQAVLDRDQGRLPAAKARIEEALKAVESLRRNIGSNALRDSFFAGKRAYYETSIDLLVRLDRRHPGEGYAGRALAASERARSRGLLDLLAEGRVEVNRGLDPDLARREAEVDAELVRAQLGLQAAQSAKSPDSQLMESLRNTLWQVEQRREVLALEIRRRNPRYAEVRYPVPLEARAVQELLDPDSALLEYAVGAEASYLFVVTRDGLTVFQLPPAAKIERRVRALREALREPATRQPLLDLSRKAAAALYRDLVAPAGDLLGHKRRLLIAPDGPLHLLPFEVLLTEAPVAGSRAQDLPYLLREYVVTYVPSASVLAEFRGPRPSGTDSAGKRLLAFGDPRFGASRATTQPTASTVSTRLWPLPKSRREVLLIAKLFPAADVAVYLDSEATEANVKSNPWLAQADRIHFATHGLVDERYPLLSGLALSPSTNESDDGVLRTSEIFGLDLSADLVVLSACETGLGKQVLGEGLDRPLPRLLLRGSVQPRCEPVASGGCVDRRPYGRLLSPPCARNGRRRQGRGTAPCQARPHRSGALCGSVLLVSLRVGRRPTVTAAPLAAVRLRPPGRARSRGRGARIGGASVARSDPEAAEKEAVIAPRAPLPLRHRPPPSSFAVVLLGLFWLFGCGLPAPAPLGLAVAAAPGAQSLLPGRPIDLQIAPGESRTFELDLVAGQYLEATVDAQREVSLTLLGPDGATLAPSGPTIKRGQQALAAVTSSAGRHRLELAGEAVACQLVLVELRAAGPLDGARVAAQRALAEAHAETQRDRVAGHLDEALRQAREAADPRLEADALNSLADLGFEQARYDAALIWSEQALAVAAGGRAPWSEAYALNNLAVILSRLDRPQESAARYREALARWEALGESAQQGWTLNNFGQFLLNDQADVDAAAAAYEQALAIAQHGGLVRLEAKSQNGLGLVARKRRDLDQMLASFRRALDLARQSGDEALEATAQRNIASAHRQRGEFQEALQLLLLALDNPQATQQTKTMTYHSLATLYVDMGDLDQARASYEKVRTLWPAEKDHAIDALINLGLVLQRQGDEAAALAHWESALELGQRNRYPMGEALARLYRGGLSVARGKPAEALPDLSRARELFHQRKETNQEAKALHQLGTAHQALADPQAAAEAFDQALRLAQGDPALTALCLRKRAELDRDQGRLAEAQAGLEEALRTVESLRRRIDSNDLRDSFFADKRLFYETYIDLLVRRDREQPGRGYAGLALTASDRARARGLLDLLAEGRVDVDLGLDPDLRRREQETTAALVRAQEALQGAQSVRSPDPARIAALQDTLRDVERRSDVLASEIRRTNPRYAEVRYPEPLTAMAVQALLDPDSALLEYAVGAEASYLFVVTREGLSVQPVPAAAALEEQVRGLRESLRDGGRRQFGRYVQKASELYRLLVAPAGDVLRRKGRLLIVPDGPLHLLPFEALLTVASPGRSAADLPYLLQSHVVSYVPSVSVLAQVRATQERSPGRGKSFLAFANPWYGPVVAGQSAALRAATALPPLPASGREVTRIAALYQPSEVEVYTDREASEENVKSNPFLTAAHRIHFATHGLIDEQQPLLSGLALARPQEGAGDGVLSAYEIFDLDLTADLVVLSACETGLGKQVSGEGIVGLARAFFFAGASSLVVSLWNVTEVSAPDLMTAFYRRLPATVGDADKAEALRRAKLEMIAGGGEQAHPYYWSPFVLVGDPR